jgi:transcriptional regulator with XRE-family HTH domain
MTRLHEYLTISGTTARRLAIDVGVSEPFVSDLRRGNRSPSLEVAQRIEAATDGRVPVHSWPRLGVARGDAA